MTIHTAAMMLLQGTYMAQRCCDIRDGRRQRIALDTAAVYSGLTARALLVVRRGPGALTEAARIWDEASTANRAAEALALVDAAEKAGRATPAAVIRDCHPLCTVAH